MNHNSTETRFRRYGELGLPENIMVQLAYDTAAELHIPVTPLLLAYVNGRTEKMNKLKGRIKRWTVDGPYLKCLNCSTIVGPSIGKYPTQNYCHKCGAKLKAEGDIK